MDTRTALLDCAEAAVRSRGYDAFSYADLAEGVGIRKASVHHHFPTKADLATALVDRYVERLMGVLAAGEEQHGDAASRLRTYLDANRDALDGGSKTCLCVAFSLGAETLDPIVLAKVNAFNEAAAQWLSGTFLMGASDGTIHDVGDPDEEGTACLALLVGAQLLAKAARDVARFDAATKRLTARLA